MNSDFVYIDYDFYSVVPYVMNESVAVADGVDFVVPEIDVLGAFVLDNSGVVSGNINVCKACKLTIRNKGVFDVTFDLADGASVVQVVSNESELKLIDFNVDYELHVVDANLLALSDIVQVGKFADVIQIVDSNLVVDKYDVDFSKLNFYGDVTLKFASVPTKPLVLSDVSNDVNFRVEVDGLSPLFAVNSYKNDNSLYVSIMRETDYTKFMSKDIGGFINSLRDDGVAPGLLYALDNAITFDELNEIMADSMRIAPINMMKIVRVFNALESIDFDSGNGINVAYLRADDSFMYGGFVNASLDTKNLDFGFRMYANSLSLTDSFDGLSGLMLGGDIFVIYDKGFGFVRGKVGGNVSLFDAEQVFDGRAGTDNPTGYSLYSAFDIGHSFDFDNGIIISPYVGANGNYMTILYQNDSFIVGRIGVEASYGFSMLGIQYDYAVRANINTGTEIIVGGRVGFMSEFDMIGGYITVDYINNEIGRGYKIAAGIDFKF